jgi:hypothetical protein
MTPADYEIWEGKALKDVEHIDSLISTPRNKEASKLWEDLDALIQWLARSGELVADAESIYESALGATIIEMSTEKKYSFATSLFRQVAEGKCADILKIYRRIERQNAALTHAIDAIRSLLSYEKENLRQISGGAQR